MGKNLARLGRFEPGSRAARWFAEAGVTAAWVYEIPLTTQFRGITARDGLILQGPGGLAEAAPFWNYAPAVARRWFEGALAIARSGLPVAPAPVALNVTVPIVSPEVAARIVRESGCRTAKVKVADPRAGLDADVARLRAVRAALDSVWGDATVGSGSGGFMRRQPGGTTSGTREPDLATGGNGPGKDGVDGGLCGVMSRQSGQAPHAAGANGLANGGNATGGGRIRVDVNAAWTLAEARENLPRLVEAAGGLEYAEQPCRNLRDLAVLQAEGVAPIAADESIRLAPDPAVAIREVVAAGLAAMIIKAMPLRGPVAALQALGMGNGAAASYQQRFGDDGKSLPSLDCLRAATADSSGLRPGTAAHSGGGDMRLRRTPPLVVVSSALDSGVGLLAGMSLATMLYQGTDPQTTSSLAGVQKNAAEERFSPRSANPQPSVAMGLGTGRLMRGGILVEEPRLEAGMLIPPVKPQLNLDLPAPDAELAARWRERLETIIEI